jgi:hypothetical protein
MGRVGGATTKIVFALLPLSCFVTTDGNLWRDIAAGVDGSQAQSPERRAPAGDAVGLLLDGTPLADGAPRPPDPATDAQAGPFACTSLAPLPLKTAGGLYAVWALSPAEVWVVGESGTTWRGAAAGWTSIPTPTTMELRGVWGSSAGAVWAVGKVGTILSFNGGKWTSVASGAGKTHIYAVWGSSDQDIWAAGSKGTILHFNGKSWSGVASPVTSTLYGLWGSGPADVWAVGASGTVLHHDGAKWSAVYTPTKRALRAVWGSSSQDVWAAGDHDDNHYDYPLALHFDGKAWKQVKLGFKGSLLGLWAGSGGEVWAAGYGRWGEGLLYHHDGSKWHDRSPGGQALWAVRGASGKVWAVGESGAAWGCP